MSAGQRRWRESVNALTALTVLVRTNNPLEWIMREIRRRTRVVGAIPDGQSALMLMAARLRHLASIKWGTRRYLDMDRLKELDDVAADT